MRYMYTQQSNQKASVELKIVLFRRFKKKNFEHVKNFKHAIISITNVYM